MAERGIDVLVAQASNDWLGGHIRYLTDLSPTCGMAVTVIFPSDGEVAVITHGAPGDVDVSGLSDGQLWAIGRVLSTPNYSSLRYTDGEERALVVNALGAYARGTIGLLTRQQLSTSVVDGIRAAYPSARIVDGSDSVDYARAIKSQEEKQLLRDTARLQDSAMARVMDFIRPGVTERDIAIEAQAATLSAGADQGVFLIGSGPVGEPAAPRLFRDQTRRIAEGDMVNVLLETNGPGGLYTHLVRTAVLGSPADVAQDELALALEAQRHTLDLIRPGADPAEIWTAHNEFMRSHGRPQERRTFCHGQGCDMLERPVMRPGETMPIAIDMNIGCHPSYAHNGVFIWVCSNFLVRADGLEPLHEFPTDFVELYPADSRPLRRAAAGGSS
jgi:Xaa-Pro aminopeptidase